MSKFQQGREKIMSFYDETETAYKPIGCLTENGLSESQDVEEGDPNKCDPSVPKSQGAYSYELTGDGQILASDDPDYSEKANIEWIRELWKTSRQDGSTVTWKESGGNGDLYGEAYITSLETTNPTTGVSTFSITLSGIGEYTETDPKV